MIVSTGVVALRALNIWHPQCHVGTYKDFAVHFCFAVFPAHVHDAVLNSAGAPGLDVHSRFTALQR